ncbi:hypothetical protein F4819DRAFT_141901 [Hypoxylon fuscum]|nr:hypothetical protein F4819DRAFT_141901 [Hypoxylon fuscum]
MRTCQIRYLTCTLTLPYIPRYITSRSAWGPGLASHIFFFLYSHYPPIPPLLLLRTTLITIACKLPFLGSLYIIPSLVVFSHGTFVVLKRESKKDLVNVRIYLNIEGRGRKAYPNPFIPTGIAGVKINRALNRQAPGLFVRIKIRVEGSQHEERVGARNKLSREELHRGPDRTITIWSFPNSTPSHRQTVYTRPNPAPTKERFLGRITLARRAKCNRIGQNSLQACSLQLWLCCLHRNTALHT